MGAPAGSTFCSCLTSHCLTVSEGQDPALLYCPSARLPGCCRAVTTGVSSEGLTGEGSAPCPRGRWQSSVPQGLLEGGASSSAGAGWRPLAGHLPTWPRASSEPAKGRVRRQGGSLCRLKSDGKNDRPRLCHALLVSSKSGVQATLKGRTLQA